MKVRPILFSGPMVRALLEGRKTQTRRVAKFTHAGHLKEPGRNRRWHRDDPEAVLARPYGQPGDLLWVREKWGRDAEDGKIFFAADRSRDEDTDNFEQCRLEGAPGYRWRSSIHMPRAASRLTLRITDVRVERLTDISGDDCIAEGAWKIEDRALGRSHEAIDAYRGIWESINGPGSWDANPWVWALSFEVIKGNLDAVGGAS